MTQFDSHSTPHDDRQATLFSAFDNYIRRTYCAEDPPLPLDVESLLFDAFVAGALTSDISELDWTADVVRYLAQKYNIDVEGITQAVDWMMRVSAAQRKAN